MSTDSWKTLDLITEASQFLATREIENPRLETELLLAAALDLRRIDLYLQFERILNETEVELFRSYVSERLRGRPVQYITGEAGFRLLDLEVTPAVLIPRPETELLVEHALTLVPDDQSTRVLDLCCGSGAVAIAMATEAASVQVRGSDLSPAALAVARRNCERHQVADRLQLVCGDLLTPFAGHACFDLILSNPPYINSSEIETLQAEVRDHEPLLALDGGADGLDVLRRIIDAAPGHLVAGGHLLVEVGYTQAHKVAELMQAADLEPSVHEDLADIPRIVVGRKTN